MKYIPCPGSKNLAVESELFPGAVMGMCPVCTKFLNVKIGDIVPIHKSAIASTIYRGK